ncbi:hypothetical protein HK101_005158 [Irineochytrium annulatum]|nr:hypothetical protein HK101_005158 [Irineochytrium annulatum]
MPAAVIPSPAAPSPTSAAALPSYTWQQVAKHNTAASCWVIVSGLVYDLTPFATRHPGGLDMLLLASGRDCTDLLPSYHPWRLEKVHAVLKKHLIGRLEGAGEFPTFPKDRGFFKDVRERVGRYFEETGKDPKDSTPGWWRLAGICVAMAACYGMAFAAGQAWGARVAWSVAFGVMQALVLLHVMHDSSHAAFTRSPLVWKWVGTLTMDVLAGASVHSWLHQHVLSHHLYTNIQQADADVPQQQSGDVRRIYKAQEWFPLYAFQWLYLPVLYSLLGLKFRVQDIVNQLIKKFNGPLRVGKVEAKHWIEQISVKTFLIYWRIVLPVTHFGLTIPQSLALFLFAELSTGIYLAWNFQVSHISSVANFPESKAEIDDEWAVNQVKTSVDYAQGDWMTTFLCGALNYQIEHHLFPSVSQYHYPAIAPIVREVCKKHNVPYNVLPSFSVAFSLHLRHLFVMGSQGPAVRVKAT